MRMTVGNTRWWGGEKKKLNQRQMVWIIKAADVWLTWSAQTAPHSLNSTPETLQPALRHERVRMKGQLADSDGSSITVSPHPEVGRQKEVGVDTVLSGCYVIKQEERWRSEGGEERRRFIMDQTAVFTWFWGFLFFSLFVFFLCFK